jgi:hypothetical protein
MAIAANAAPCKDERGIERLNQDCYCVTLDCEALHRELEAELGARGLSATLTQTHPHLFASVPVFVSRAHIAAMQRVIEAIETVVALPAYRERVLAWAPAIAGWDPGPRGVFYGHDFHLGPDGPRLIEINTNAGGALLNAVLARAQRACCDAMEPLLPGGHELASFESAMVAMFRAEYRLQCGDTPLRAVAIVDDDPAGQFLYPEFLLFERLMQRAGISAVIADARSLTVREGALWHGDTKIDLVYNRLTDFSLAAVDHAALRDAYLQKLVVVTPHPRAHALYADKRNLSLLTDAEILSDWNVSPEVIATLIDGIAATHMVDGAHADALWRERRQLFFKPAGGYGSKAAYRGDKLTRRVWSEILEGDYVAQAYVPPSERGIRTGTAPFALKLDLRNYVYGGAVMFVAARLYQGQTTNFRTAQGGFATVFHP